MLSSIPPAIKDLANLVSLPTRPSAAADSTSFDTSSSISDGKSGAAGRAFKRFTTAPAIMAEKSKSIHSALGVSKFNRGKSMKVAFGTGMGLPKTYEGEEQEQEQERSVMKNEVQLFLQNNLIRVLPPELCYLKNLVVLSLRGFLLIVSSDYLSFTIMFIIGFNRLEEIPHYISHLTGLRELNVSNNNLTHLPAEIMELGLISLSVNSNPFYAYPTPLEQGSWLGEVCLRDEGGVPSLREVGLRVLINTGGPESESGRKGISVLEERYELPLPAYEQSGISPDLHTLLSFGSSPSTGVTSSIAIRTLTNHSIPQPRNPLHSFCPSPKHLQEGVVYIEPTISRLEWVDRIGAVNIPAPRVPVLWRGCSVGCLNFLEEDINTMCEDVVMEEVAGLGPNNESFDLSSDEE